MYKFSLKKAQEFAWRFADKPQEISGHKKKMWVRMQDYDELDGWFSNALQHIKQLRREINKLKKNQKPSRK